MKDLDASTKFEDFVNYVSIPKLEETSESIEGVNVGNNGNPGVDGLAIIVNDHIVHSTEEVDYFLEQIIIQVENMIEDNKTKNNEIKKKKGE